MYVLPFLRELSLLMTKYCSRFVARCKSLGPDHGIGIVFSVRHISRGKDGLGVREGKSCSSGEEKRLWERSVSASRRQSFLWGSVLPPKMSCLGCLSVFPRESCRTKQPGRLVSQSTGPISTVITWLVGLKKNYIQHASRAPRGLWMRLAGSDQIRHICPEDINQ